jgi:hypothetical protein
MKCYFRDLLAVFLLYYHLDKITGTSFPTNFGLKFDVLVNDEFMNLSCKFDFNRSFVRHFYIRESDILIIYLNIKIYDQACYWQIKQISNDIIYVLSFHTIFLMISKVITVLPICMPCLIFPTSKHSFYYFTNVPNLDLLSKIKKSSPILSIFEWFLETEMSAIRISH